VKTCTYHCSKCGRHFHSLESFDAHRTGNYASDDPETGRRCLAPCEVLDARGLERLVAITEEGECRLYAKTERNVTIWTLRREPGRFARIRSDAAESLAQAA
jgi:hypothetical protein